MRWDNRLHLPAYVREQLRDVRCFIHHRHAQLFIEVAVLFAHHAIVVERHHALTIVFAGLSRSRSRARALLRRDMTVPTGSDRTDASSFTEKPSTTPSMRISRCSPESLPSAELISADTDIISGSRNCTSSMLTTSASSLCLLNWRLRALIRILK